MNLILKRLSGTAKHAVTTACLSVFLLLMFGAAQAQWDYGLNLEAGVIRSDNIFLDPTSERKSDTVFLIVPELYAETDSERLTANFRYRPEAVFYDEFSDADEIYHVVDASLTRTLIDEHFFVNLSAVKFQSLSTPERSVPLNNVNITENRVDSVVYSVKPYWEHDFGGTALLASVGYTGVDYDQSSFQETEERDAYLRVDNLSKQEGLAWQLDYRYREIDYDISAPFQFQRASLNLGYWFTGAFRLFAAGGAESPIDDLAEIGLESEFWEAGFQYKPNTRLSLEVAGGKRSYGDSFRGNFRYELRRGELIASYSESPSTRTELLFDRRPILDDRPVDGLLDQPGSADRLVLKRGEVEYRYEATKTEFSARVFLEKSENVSTADGTPLKDESLDGYGIRVDRRLGNRTDFYFAVDFGSRETQRPVQSGDFVFYDDELRLLTAGFLYSLTRKIDLRLEFVRTEQDGATVGEEYVDRQYRLFFLGSF